MFLTNLSLKRPVLAMVVILGMLAVGISSFLSLGMNDMPEVNLPYVAVSFQLSGASPDQVESKIAKKVEEAVGQISGVNHITTNINEGLCQVIIAFDDSVSVDTAAEDVRTKVNGIRNALPGDMEDPVYYKFDPNSSPIMSLAVSGGNLNPRDRAELVNNTIIPALNTVSGVGSVTTYGLQDREIQILLDKEKLAAYNLTTDQVLAGLRSDNVDRPSGKVSDEGRETTLRTNGEITNIEGFNDVLLISPDGTEIRVRDVAQVVDGFEDVQSLSYYNGQQSVGIDIVKQSGVNTVSLADSLKTSVAEIQEILPPGVKLSVVADNSVDIRGSVNNVRETLIEGCILAVLIVFLFLRSASATAISAISLPTSIITTFAALSFMGFTLNLMTLMGLSLAVGLLIDDSIVVIENITRHLHMGKTPVEAAIDGTSEISLAVLATTLTVVAVFVPMAAMSGTLGAFFKEFALTIAFSVLISLFVSFTLVPLLASRYARDQERRTPRTPIGKFLAGFNHAFDHLSVYYEAILGVVLRHRTITLTLTLLLFVASLGLITQMPFSFQPDQDKGKVTVIADLDAGLTMEAAREKAMEMEAVVHKYPEVNDVYTTVKNNSVSVVAILNDKEDRERSSQDIARAMRPELQAIPGLDLSVSGTSSNFQSGKSYTIHLQGDDFDQLLAYSWKAKQVLAEIPGAVDVGISYKAGKPEIQIVVDKNAAADLGVNATNVSNTLVTLFNGSVVGQYTTGNDRYNIKVRLADQQRRDLQSLDGIYLAGANGNMVPLDQVTRTVYTTSSASLSRYDKSREIQIQANLNNISSGELNTLFLERLDKEQPMPAGIRTSAGGNEANTEESMNSLLQAVILGILFVFLILAAQFESFIDPLAIMLSLPLAIIGALVALFISGAGLTMVGGIGIIFLLGLVTKNAILLVDFIKQGRSEDVDRHTAILAAGTTRLRPILMTTLAMIFGMLPAVAASGAGSEMRQPMAIAIVGGLVSSTLLTLLVVPVVYTILDDIKGWFRKLAGKSASAPEASR